MSRLLRDLLVAPLIGVALLACAPDASNDQRDTDATVDASAAAARGAQLNADLLNAPQTSAAAAAAASDAAPPGGERSARRVVLYGVDLTGVGYDKGDPNAPIVMVDFSDFGCPYCGNHARQTLPELEREFIATG